MASQARSYSAPRRERVSLRPGTAHEEDIPLFGPGRARAEHPTYTDAAVPVYDGPRAIPSWHRLDGPPCELRGSSAGSGSTRHRSHHRHHYRPQSRRDAARTPSPESSLSYVSSRSGGASPDPPGSSASLASSGEYARHRHPHDRGGSHHHSHRDGRRSHTPGNGIPPVRWVPERGEHRADAGVLPFSPPPAPWVGTAESGGVDAKEGVRGRVQRAYTPPHPLTGAIAGLQPSPLLVEVVRSIAYYRNVPCPADIYPEVILAFDEYLARGVTMRKFVRRSPPHNRFFAFRFLDLQPRRGKGGVCHGSMPEAVFCWYRTSESRSMRRFFPLSDLVDVRRGGEGHPYIMKRKVKSSGGAGSPPPAPALRHGLFGRDSLTAGTFDHSHSENTDESFMLMRYGSKGIFKKYVDDALVLQLCFRSLLTNSEEVIAVQAPNSTVLLALHVACDYFARIGQGAHAHARSSRF